MFRSVADVFMRMWTCPCECRDAKIVCFGVAGGGVSECLPDFGSDVCCNSSYAMHTYLTMTQVR